MDLLDEIRAQMMAPGNLPKTIIMPTEDFASMNGVPIRSHRKRRISKKWFKKAMAESAQARKKKRAY